jgi:hypothetical protein
MQQECSQQEQQRQKGGHSGQALQGPAEAGGASGALSATAAVAGRARAVLPELLLECSGDTLLGRAVALALSQAQCAVGSTGRCRHKRFASTSAGCLHGEPLGQRKA